MENKYEFFIAGRNRNKENILKICDLFDKYNISYYCFLKNEDNWGYGMAVINNGKESTYTWSKEDFYMVDKPSSKINPGYLLNTISINKKLNKYFTDITEEDKALVKEDESDVVEFIVNSIKGDKQ